MAVGSMAQTRGRVLIADAERDFCEILVHLLKHEGFEPNVVHDGQAALDMIHGGLSDAVLVDTRMPGVTGPEFLRQCKTRHPDLPVLVITAPDGPDYESEAMEAGAWGCLPKPLDKRLLVDTLKRALASPSMAEQGTPLPSERKESTGLPLREIMGPSEAVARISRDIEVVAPSAFTVIIQGETGTGKELVARAIHRASAWSEATLVPLDCGAIPESLFESELFGYEKGAFTGALTARAGKFELAQKGTLFLDEIGNMPLRCQVKLLRAIQERTFFRVGGRDPVSVNVRLLVATNQDLSACVSRGTFSRDLFYRLNEFTITIPPLRDRKEDIVHLCHRFLKATNMELNKKVRGFTDSALRLLAENPWPGNVRQLRSTIRRAVLQTDTTVGPEHLALETPTWETTTGVFPYVPDSLSENLPLREIVRRTTAEVERRVLTRVLKKTGGNKAKAARMLQVDYKTIHSKIKEYAIEINPEDENSQENGS
jgi:two-component system nitrogen regulation response regulator GlnG